jgi:hypothetical protein
MRFFNSKNVKIFPCSNRGTYSSTVEYEASETLDSVFDLESRLASEYNFTNLSGIINNKKSYVISFEQLPYPITRSQDPTHSHSFDENGVCRCGVLSSGHTHQFNANNICSNCGWEPDYLLKVVINGYYFEIITKKFPIFTVSSGTSLINDYKSILESKLWITLQKTSLREADLHDNARHTYQLGSMFARSYTGTYEAEKANEENPPANSSNYYLSQHFEVLEAGKQPTIPVSTIINGSIALNKLDFPANHVAGSIAKEYYCAAIGITSNDNSLEPWVGKEGEEAPDGHFKVLLERESGETEADVVLCCLDLSDPANWLENLAAGKFLNSPEFSNRVEGPEELDVEKLFVTSIAPTQIMTETGPNSGSLDIQATTITSNSIDAATMDAAVIEAGKIKATATLSAPEADLDEIVTDKASISALIVPSLECITLDKGTESTDDDKSLKAEIDDLIDAADTLVKADLRGDLKLVAKTTENGLEADITLPEDVSITSIYGTTACLATSIDNWSESAAGAWNPEIPTDLTLTGLKKEISCLTAAGGEPNKINKILLSENEITPDGNKAIELAGQIKLEHLHASDKNRVSTLETIIGKTTFDSSTDTSIVAEIANLKDSLKNLDNVMNFIGVISADELRTYTGKNTYSETKNIEVGDVVVVSAEGGFNYSEKRYEDGTEFICTGVSDNASTWQEIGTCNITTSAINHILGEDTDDAREGSIKGRLCATEDGIDTLNEAIGIGDYSETENTILKRIKAIEDGIGEDVDEGNTGDSTIKGRLGSLETIVGAYESEDSIGDRLSSLEDLTSDTGEIMTAISDILGDIGDAATDTDGTIVDRLDSIEEAIGGNGTTESILDRLATIEGILDGTGDAGDSDEGEVDSSITGRLTAVDSRLTAVETNIGDVVISNVVERISALEDNEIVKAAANLTLDDFKTSIEDAVIEDEDFINKVEGFIGTTVDGQATGKVIDFIETFAETANFKDRVRTEIGYEIATFAQTSEFTDAVDSRVDSQIASYVASDDFEAKVDTEIVSNYVLDSTAAIEAIHAKASEQAQLYTLDDDDKAKINEKASAVAQSYTLTEDDEGTVNTKVQATIGTMLDSYSISETTFEEKLEPKVKTKLATYISDTYDLTADDKEAVETKVVTYISNDYVFDADEQIQPIIDGKATTAVNNAITAYTIAADNDTIGSKVTEAYNTKIDQYTIASTNTTITAKVNSAFYNAVQNMKIVALAFNSNEVPVDPALIKPVVAVSGSSVTLPTLTSDGKTFRGWHTDKDSAEAYFVVYAPQDNTIYYAIWGEAPETEG